jgi:hypothetical protein
MVEKIGRDMIMKICGLLDLHTSHNFMICCKTTWFALRLHPYRNLRNIECCQKYKPKSLYCVRCKSMISKRHRHRHVNRCHQRGFCKICNQYYTDDHNHATPLRIDITIWSLLFDYLPRTDWVNTALVCHSANRGLSMMMMNRYGGMNTWMADCPVFAHRWKCQRHPQGPMRYIAPYPDAFKNPSSTNFRPKGLIEGSEWVRFRFPEIVVRLSEKKKMVVGNHEEDDLLIVYAYYRNLLNEIKEENNYEHYYSDDE